jgi:hypothetical protein
MNQPTQKCRPMCKTRMSDTPQRATLHPALTISSPFGPLMRFNGPQTTARHSWSTTTTSPGFRLPGTPRELTSYGHQLRKLEGRPGVLSSLTPLAA